jgi:dipeptidyl aminopeptidase/acylaminoacyl peptidase
LTSPLTPDAIVYDLASAGEPRISPNGARIVFSLGKAERGKKSARSQVWLIDRDGGNPRQISTGGTKNGTARWSPDGRSISFVSDNVEKPATSGLFIVDADGGEPRLVTSHTVTIGEVEWSPDGTQLAYIALFDPANPDEAEPGAEDAPPVRVVKRIDYKQDNRGFLNDVRQQLWIVDAATGARRRVTSNPEDHNFPSWSPDSGTIAVKIPRKNGMASQLGLVDLASDITTLVGPANGTAGVWAWSPDGAKILIAGDDRQTWQYDFFVYHVATGELERLTDDLPVLPDSGFPTISAPSQPVWLDDRVVLFHATRGGKSGLYTIDTKSAELQQRFEWEGMHGGLSVDDSRLFAVQAQSNLELTGEIVVTDLKKETSATVTSLNRPLFAESPPAAWERFDIRRGEFTIEAWLLKPPGFDPAKKYPVILDIHGGPNSFYGYNFNGSQQTLAAAGFLVVYSNPRGSGSYGRHFTTQVTKDWGGEDYLDLLAVMDEVLKRPYADPERTGIYGYSYGGFMTSWMIGHTDRFKAALIGAPVVDLVSFYGTADIGHTFGPLQIGGTPQENEEEYRFRSPLTYLKDAKTPVLIIHGEADDRVPVSQGEQLFAILHEEGADVTFVRYPGGSHAMLRTGYPAHRLDTLERIAAFFTEKLA